MFLIKENDKNIDLLSVMLLFSALRDENHPKSHVPNDTSKTYKTLYLFVGKPFLKKNRCI